jgi:tRNA(Arg) A34 adenosine deaminase TadA
MQLDKYMVLAIEEAKVSLREGNNGFGAVIVKEEQLIALAHDKECTEHDATAHAEINAIKKASKKLGKNLLGCILISTHEPCPMCATAIVWAGIAEIAYGYSIQQALEQGRKRIELNCRELFKKAKTNVKIHENILHDECARLYRNDVRAEVEKLRHADDKKLTEMNTESANKRVKWFEENRKQFSFLNEDPLMSGYKLLLKRFNIIEDQAPIATKSDQQIVFHSKNFCPTLEACKILGLDTRKICKKLNENSTERLLKQIDRNLHFSRNYDKLRPNTSYCEEIISSRKGETV